MISEKQLKEKIIKLETKLKILKEVLETPKDGKFGRPKGSTIYSDKQINFLKEHKNTSMKILIELFKKEFNTNYKKDSRDLYNLKMNKMNIKQLLREINGKDIINIGDIVNITTLKGRQVGRV